MARKLVALFLVVSIISCMFSGCASTQEASATTEVEVSGFDISVVETDDKREASTIVEGVSLKCEHIFSTDEYWLYLEEEPIHLSVATFDDHIEVYMADEVVFNYDEQVVGQFVLTMSLATPVFIAAAKALVATVVGVTLTATVCVSADALGNVIGGIKSNTSTYYQYRTFDVSAADAIRFGRMKRYNTYYVAQLSGNTVMVGREISEWEAISRLERGYDVFATSAFAAGWVAMKASTGRAKFYASTPHQADDEGYYPHYHAYGRKWVNNSKYAPHAWYPYK